MSIVSNEEVYSYKDVNPIVPYGLALMDGGLLVGGAINGYGALTRGFLWQLFSIWFDVQNYDLLSTSWVSSESVITTTWTNTETIITTTWTNSSGGIFGDYTP